MFRVYCLINLCFKCINIKHWGICISVKIRVVIYCRLRLWISQNRCRMRCMSKCWLNTTIFYLLPLARLLSWFSKHPSRLRYHSHPSFFLKIFATRFYEHLIFFTLFSIPRVPQIPKIFWIWLIFYNLQGLALWCSSKLQLRHVSDILIVFALWYSWRALTILYVRQFRQCRKFLAR